MNAKHAAPDVDDSVSEPVTRKGKRHSVEDDSKGIKRPALSDMTNKPQDRARVTRSQSQKKKEVENRATVSLSDETYDEWESIPHADIDVGDDADPQLCSVYVQEIYSYLRENQEKYRPIDYLQTQKDINSAMRAILVDWLVEVAEEYNLSSETLYLAVSYVDRYLSKKAVTRGSLQLVGVASVLIAAKYEEIYAPSVDDMVFISDNTYSKEEVFSMESRILDALEFRLSGATIRGFLKRFLKAAGVGSDATVSMFASYLCELSLQEYNFLKYLPSVIAASATFLALYTLNKKQPYWNSTLEYYTHHRISDPEMRACIIDLHNLHKAAPKSNLQAVQEKYEGLCKVSNHRVIPPAASLHF